MRLLILVPILQADHNNAPGVEVGKVSDMSS